MEQRLTAIPVPDVKEDDALRRHLERALGQELGYTRRRADSNRNTRLGEVLDLLREFEVLSEEFCNLAMPLHAFYGAHHIGTPDTRQREDQDTWTARFGLLGRVLQCCCQLPLSSASSAHSPS